MRRLVAMSCGCRYSQRKRDSEDAKFKTYGCGSAIASSSLLTEWVKGKTLEQAQQIKNTDIAEVGAAPVKVHCSVLAEDAIRAAVEDFASKQNK